MAKSETGRLLTPLGVAGALALAAGAWFVPLPDPSGTGKVIRVGPAGGDPGATGRVAIGPTPDHDWMALAEPLRKLRDPVVVPEPPGGEEGPVPPPTPPISVRYLGFVGASEGRAAALLDIEGTQQFVSLGQTVTVPNRAELLISEITPEKVVYEIDTVSTTVTREQRNTTPGSLAPARPSRDQRPMSPPIPPNEDNLRGNPQDRNVGVPR